MNRVALKAANFHGGTSKFGALGTKSDVFTGTNLDHEGNPIQAQVWLYPDQQLVEVVVGAESFGFHTALVRMVFERPLCTEEAKPAPVSVTNEMPRRSTKRV
jgi:hypothetical protein